jgi:ribosomal protein S18 acetylase RimI-like enzyme
VSDDADALAIAPLADADVEAVVALWERCGLTRPWNDPRADIALARRGPNSTILVGKATDTVVASAMVGHDGHRGWFYYVAVDPARQKQGCGRIIMAAAEAWLKARGILKAELMVRPENGAVQAFYAALGYATEPRIVMSKWLDGHAPAP